MTRYDDSLLFDRSSPKLDRCSNILLLFLDLVFSLRCSSLSFAVVIVLQDAAISFIRYHYFSSLRFVVEIGIKCGADAMDPTFQRSIYESIEMIFVHETVCDSSSKAQTAVAVGMFVTYALSDSCQNNNKKTVLFCIVPFEDIISTPFGCWW